MAELPTGTVTLLFTDIEGSTRLLQELGRDRYVQALTDQRRLVREAFTRHGGVEVEMQGDSFHFAFAHAHEAVAAAAEAQRALAEHDWESEPIRIRIGIHTGEPVPHEGLYAGLDVHRAARIMSAGHGGQVLISERTRSLLDGETRLTDLGLHRLKDLTEPEKVYQVGEGEFPPLKTLDATNLPVAASPLLGRERELEELVSLLNDGTRLVTVTGTGGAGKTRLALQVAAELVGSHSDGVFWVPLAGLTQPDLVLPHVAQTLGVRVELTEHLRGKELVILLDNAEHLLPAAPALAHLLAGAKRLRLLVTSRAPLRLSGELEYPLQPLPESDAVMLFCERARAIGGEVEPNETAGAICRRLDGLPLAIELAAARTKLLAPETLLGRLEHALPLLTKGTRDAPERQQTLRATIEWSYDLLGDDAKQLFARLAVFAGSFSLEAVEEVAGANLDSLAALVDLSLLKPIGDERFLMLETIREYATERLKESAELDVVRERHAAHFLAVAELAESELQGSEQALWLERLEEERSNLRAALDWAAAVGAAETELRLATALRDFWSARGPVAEALSRLESAARRAGDALPERRLAALRAAALSAVRAGDHKAAERLAGEFLELARSLGDRESEVSALIKLGAAAATEGKFDQARSRMEQAVAAALDAGDARMLGHALLNRGALALAEGDAEGAAHLCERSLSEGGSALDARGRTTALLNLAFARVQLGDARSARESGRQALEIALAQGDRYSTADGLTVLAAAAARDDAEGGARLLGAANALQEEVGANVDDELGPELCAALGDAAYEHAYADGRALSLEEAVELARSLDSG